MSQSRRKMHRSLPKIQPRVSRRASPKPVEYLNGRRVVDATEPLSFQITPAILEAANMPYTDIYRMQELELGRPMRPSERLLRIAVNDAYPGQFVTSVAIEREMRKVRLQVLDVSNHSCNGGCLIDQIREAGPAGLFRSDMNDGNGGTAFMMRRADNREVVVLVSTEDGGLMLTADDLQETVDAYSLEKMLQP